MNPLNWTEPTTNTQTHTLHKLVLKGLVTYDAVTLQLIQKWLKLRPLTSPKSKMSAICQWARKQYISSTDITITEDLFIIDNYLHIKANKDSSYATFQNTGCKKYRPPVTRSHHVLFHKTRDEIDMD